MRRKGFFNRICQPPAGFKADTEAERRLRAADQAVQQGRGWIVGAPEIEQDQPQGLHLLLRQGLDAGGGGGTEGAAAVPERRIALHLQRRPVNRDGAAGLATPAGSRCEKTTNPWYSPALVKLSLEDYKAAAAAGSAAHA